MRFAECHCKHCKVTFLIKLENDIPKQKHMFCPICGADNVEVNKIDGRRF